MKDFLKNIKLNENNIGFGLGIAVMILTGILLVNYFKSINNKNATSQDSQTLSTSTDQPGVSVSTPVPLTVNPDGTLRIEGNQPKLGDQITTLATEGGDYTIVKGDSLWKIAQKHYGSGYAWTKIYEANKQVLGKNPSVLIAGTVLALPKLEQTAASEMKSYTVVKGDSLWKIATAQCGSGFAWSAIATQNNITSPSKIYANTTLSFTCPVTSRL